jgi:hypothetical protein
VEARAPLDRGGHRRDRRHPRLHGGARPPALRGGVAAGGGIDPPPTRAYAFEQEPTEVSLRPGACTESDIEGISSNFVDGPCEALRTASGRAVFTGPSEGTVDGRDGFALLDGTLVRLISVGLSDRDVLAWYDSLRPVDVEDIDFKG